MGALKEPKLLKLEVRTSQNMVLYSISATTSLSNLCYNCIGKQLIDCRIFVLIKGLNNRFIRCEKATSKMK